MSDPTIITGLFTHARNGVRSEPKKVIAEMKDFLRLNSSYKNKIVCLAGDKFSASLLEENGLTVTKIFDDAPQFVKRDATYKMKHWMVLWALKRCGEVLWVDWDTIFLQFPDKEFWEWCRKFNTPKFVYIENYWATVNCSVYYVNSHWIPEMERSFTVEVSEPNDELMWTAVLPRDVREREEFWMKDRAVNVWELEEISRITQNTYFVHVRTFNVAKSILKHFKALQ